MTDVIAQPGVSEQRVTVVKAGVYAVELLVVWLVTVIVVAVLSVLVDAALEQFGWRPARWFWLPVLTVMTLLIAVWLWWRFRGPEKQLFVRRLYIASVSAAVLVSVVGQSRYNAAVEPDTHAFALMGLVGTVAGWLLHRVVYLGALWWTGTQDQRSVHERIGPANIYLVLLAFHLFGVAIKWAERLEGDLELLASLLALGGPILFFVMMKRLVAWRIQRKVGDIRAVGGGIVGGETATADLSEAEGGTA